MREAGFLGLIASATRRSNLVRSHPGLERAMTYLNNQEVLSVANMNAEGVHHLQPRVDAH